jgi:hypothetical protein
MIVREPIVSFDIVLQGKAAIRYGRELGWLK